MDEAVTGGAFPEGLAVPDSFFVEEITLTGSLADPTALSFLSDGGVLIGEKSGMVWYWREDMASLQPALDLSEEVYAHGARGLSSMVTGTGGSGNLYVFLLYTVSDVPDSVASGAFGRIVRYQFDEASRTVLDESRAILLGASFEGGIPACTANHRVGELRMGADNALLVATSDAADHNQFDRGGMHASCFGTERLDDGEDIGAFRAQSLTSLSGKVLRLDPETGLGLPSNPFFSGSGSNTVSKLWAYGFREPIGLTLLSDAPSSDHPGNFIIGDRGWNVLEELNRIQEGGGNYGWPCEDGLVASESYAADPLADVFCSGAQESSRPLRWWNHQNPLFSNPSGLSAIRLAGAARYAGDRYPAYYKGRLFYADGVRGWMATLASSEANDQDVFSLTTGDIHDLLYNPHDGYLYFIDRARKTAARLRHERNRTVITLNSINQDIEGAGQGLFGRYYDKADFTGESTSRIESELVYDAFESPTSATFNAVRWEGILIPDFTESYTIYLNTRGNSQLYINDSLLVDYSDQDIVGEDRRVQVAVSLHAGEKYWLQINHYSDSDSVKGGLEWSSRSQPRAPIPGANFMYRFSERINLCRIQKATISMSSTLSPFAAAGNACDGNTNGDFFEGSVAVSAEEDHPFWQVDIGELRDVRDISLWGRTDCCTESLEGAFVIVSSSPFGAEDLSVLSEPGVSGYIVSDLKEATITIPVNRTIRYVRIQHPSERTLNLAEVEISAGVGNEAGAPPVEGLVGWWSFEEGPADRRGANDGDLKSGARIVPDTERQFVLELDEAGDYVDVRHADELNGTVALTYAAWMYPFEWGDEVVLLSKSSNGQMHLGVSNGELVGRAPRATELLEVRSGLPVLDTWTHVALVYAGNRLRLYVDGILVDEAQSTYASLVLNDASFEIGSSEDTDAVFRGRIDDVVIYNTALQPSDLAALIDAASNVAIDPNPEGTIDSDLLALYPNPFSSQVTLQFRLTGAEFVRAVIYDGLGRRIVTLEESMLASGVHSLTWNGLDGWGQRMPSGMYVVRLELGGVHVSTPVIRL